MTLRRRLLPLAFFVFFLPGCGTGYKDTFVRDYRLYFNTSDAKIKETGRRLITEYNQRVGEDVLHFADKAEDANSPITFVDGLRREDGKLGYGQWETETFQEPAYRAIEGRKLNRKTIGTMNIELDRGYFTERMNLPDSNKDWQELFLLFAHEVGHGLQMDHDPNDPKSVMYPYIDGVEGVKFDEYFARVRAYFHQKA